MPATEKSTHRFKTAFLLNGELIEADAAESRMMVADYLRYQRGLTGTKIVCAEGDCGACTILVLDPRNPKSGFVSLNSCIFRVAQLDGLCTVTVEALGPSNELSPVQEKMKNAHASQCGFCTPGFVMATAGLVEKRICSKNSAPVSPQEAKNALTGNLCRCTGYAPIIEAACAVEVKKCEPLSERFAPKSKVKSLIKATSKPLLLGDSKFKYFAPKTLGQAVQFKKRFPEAQILSAGTDLGVVYNKGKQNQSLLLTLRSISGLSKISTSGKRVKVGANTTLTELRDFLKGKAPEIVRFLDRFASPQIKNVATLIGNVANASPIAECPPFLLALNANVYIEGGKGKRKVPIEKFFLAYRKTALAKNELITHIDFEIPGKDEHFSLTKVSQRIDLDISTVNTAFRIKMDRKTGKVLMARMAMGGVAATPIRLTAIEKYLEGQIWSQSLKAKALDLLAAAISPLSDVRGSSAYRRVVSQNILEGYLDGLGQ